MDETFEINVEDIVDALSFKPVDNVWREYVEVEDVAEARVYWRNVFFHAINQVNLFPYTFSGVPEGKDFVNMMVKLNGTI